VFLQTAKEIFLLIGAVLGIVAFCKTMLDPILESNRKKWEEIKKRVDELHFQNLEFEIEQQRLIDMDTLRPIEKFVMDIRDDVKYLRFGPVLGREFSTHLNNLRNHYLKFRDYVQTPYWEPVGDVTDREVQVTGLKLNKDAFDHRDHICDGHYAVNIDNAADQAEKMRMEFRALSILANLHLLELPFARRIVRQRAAVPSRLSSKQAETVSA
jgi:hypothetical protein